MPGLILLFTQGPTGSDLPPLVGTYTKGGRRTTATKRRDTNNGLFCDLQYFSSDLLLFVPALVLDPLFARAVFDSSPKRPDRVWAEISGFPNPIFLSLSPLIPIVYCLVCVFSLSGPAIYAILGISYYLLTICFCLVLFCSVVCSCSIPLFATGFLIPVKFATYQYDLD